MFSLVHQFVDCIFVLQMSVTNALAYFDPAKITAVKSFEVQVPGISPAI